MIVKYSPSFLAIIKKADVRIRKSFKERIDIFSKDPYHLHLNNHALKNEYQGYRSIDVTSDWRAIYEEIIIEEEITVYFIAIGTHKDLYER